MKRPTIQFKINRKKIINPCHSIIWGEDGEIETFTCYNGDHLYQFSNHFGKKDEYFSPSGNLEAFILFY